MKTIITIPTRESLNSNTTIFQSLAPLVNKIGLDWNFVKNNTDGLSKVYNESIKTYVKDYDCMIFAHDDIYIDDGFVIDKIEDGFNNGYDIVGVAGGIDPAIKAPALWHLMCGRDNLRGAAGHFNEDMSSIHITSFGSMPSRVTLLDGLFLAVNTKRILEVGWQFNENYDFHLYDIASCLDANKLKLKLGVLPIHVIHKSPGLRDINDECFQRNQTKFLKEYAP